MKCNLKRIVTGNDVAIRMVRNRTVQSPQPVVFSCRFLAASTVGDIEKWVYDDDDHYHDRTDDSLTWAQKNDDRREIARLSARSLVSIIWLIKARWFSFELFLKLYQVTLILLENYRAFFSFQSLKINFNPLRTLSFSHLNPFYLVRRNNHRKKICFANFCNFYLRVFFWIRFVRRLKQAQFIRYQKQVCMNKVDYKPFTKKSWGVSGYLIWIRVKATVLLLQNTSTRLILQENKRIGKKKQKPSKMIIFVSVSGNEHSHIKYLWRRIPE